MTWIREINTRLQTMSVSVQKEEVKEVHVVLMEDNHTTFPKYRGIESKVCSHLL